MAEETFTFKDGTRIGLIVRGKTSPTHHPDVMAQHADVILPNGAPIGFFGEGNDNSGNGIGMRMQGVVYDYARLRIERPYYVDYDQAVANRVVSTVLLVTVTAEQAKAFQKSWTAMTVDPGNFNILGGNCATHASASFIEAKVVSSGIPWLDTPDRLYDQLVAAMPAASLRSISGYVGFTQVGSDFTMRVKIHEDNPKVNRPNPGSSGSLSST